MIWMGAWPRGHPQRISGGLPASHVNARREAETARGAGRVRPAFKYDKGGELVYGETQVPACLVDLGTW